MLESESRGLLLVALVACLCLAPVASASLEGMEAANATVAEARQTAADAREDAANNAPQTGTEADPVVQDALTPEGDPETKDVEAAAAPLVVLVTDLAITLLGVVDSLPDDPLVIVDQVEPITHAATGMLPASDAYRAEDPAPATGTADIVKPTVSTEMIVAGASAAAAAALLVLWLAGSSGSVGAGAAGTAGASGSSELRRLLPFASPLFTRFEKDTVLGHPKREALYALILQDPGVSLQSLCDSTGLSRTAVTHHLRLLEMQHLIISKRMGRSRHYFENGGRFGRDQKEAYAVLHNGRSKDVARFVRDHPGSIQKAVCEALGIQPSIAHWHLRRLQEARLVEAVRHGRTVSYFPGTSLQSLDRPAIPAAAPEPASAVPEAPVPVPLPMMRASPA